MNRLTAVLLTVPLLLLAQAGLAQNNNGSSYGYSNGSKGDQGFATQSIFNRNKSSNSNKPGQKNAKATPAPGAQKSTTANRGTSSSTRATSGTRTSSSAHKTATKGGPAALSGAPQSTGQVKEITKSFLDSIRTQKVDYDEEEMAQNPGVLLLNSRKYKPEKSKLQRSHQSRSPIAQPL